MAKKMKALQIDVFHHDCFGSLTTKDFPTVSVKNLSYAHIVRENNKMIGYQIVVEITADTEKELNEFIKVAKNFKTVKEFEIWSRMPRKIFAFIKVKTNNSSYEAVLKNGAMHFDHTRMERGYDVHSVVTTNFKDIKSVLNGLEEIGEIKVTKIGMPNSVAVEKDFMTEKQIDALRKAISHQYYSWPRRVTLEYLAKQSNMSRRAYQEHLRKAESKLFPELVRDYLLMNRSK